MTKTQIINFIILFTVFTARGQQYELGFNIGAGNYIGDLGNEYYFMPNKVGAGVMFKNTFNPWFGIRFNANYHPIYTDDQEAESLGRRKRNLKAEATLWDLSVGIEYKFLPRNPFLRPKRLQRITPYMYSGLGIGSFYGSLYRNTDNEKLHEYTGSGLFIPMSLGVKYRISEHLIFGVETSAQYYFSDNLDGTAAYYKPERLEDNPSSLQINPKSNDWYTYTSISIIYTFGDLLCYFNLR